MRSTSWKRMRGICWGMSALGIMAAAIAASPGGDAVELQKGFEMRIVELVPGMGAERIEDRQAAQRAFEKMCMESSGPAREAERAALCRAILAHCGPQTARPARIWMLRVIATISGEESVAGLAALLTDDDAEVRETARRALMGNPAAGAGAALREALETARDARWRLALIQALDHRREEANLAPLARYVTDPDWGLARAAITAIGRISSPAAADLILRMSPDSRPEVSTAQVDARLRAAEFLAERGETDRAAGVYESLAAPEAPEQVRLAALQGLSRVRGSAFVPRLVEMLGGSDPRWAVVAEQCLREMPDPRTGAALLAALPGASSELQVEIIRVLGERKDTGVAGGLAGLVTHADPAVSLAALRALRTAGDKSVVRILAATAANGSEEQKEAARESLAHLRADGVEPEILALSQGEEPPTVRAELIRAMGARRMTSALPVLRQAAGAPDAAIRAAAVAALGRVGAEVDLPVILGAVFTSKEADTLKACEEALAAITERIEGPARRVQPLISALPQAPAPGRAALIRVLGRLQGDAALAVVSERVGDEDLQVRRAAVEALAGWNTDAPLGTLAEVAATGDAQLRETALAGVIRLATMPGPRPPSVRFGVLARAWELAARPDLKSAILRSMGATGSPEALKFLMPLLDDATMKAAAEQAVADLAVALLAADSEASQAALARVRRQTGDAGLRGRIDRLLELIGRHLLIWQWSGPYRAEGRKAVDLFDIPFDPEKPGASVEWQPLVLPSDLKSGVIPLGGTPPPNDCCGYLRAILAADRPTRAILAIGSDDGVKVWLNGQVVHANNTLRACTCGEDKVVLDLKAGPNTLMLKITQGGAEWSVCGMLTAEDGSPLTGVQVRSP